MTVPKLDHSFMRKSKIATIVNEDAHYHFNSNKQTHVENSSLTLAMAMGLLGRIGVLKLTFGLGVFCRNF